MSNLHENATLDAIEGWAAQSPISARSLIVTIIGDTLIPVTSSVWMAQMMSMTEVFGFSGRLVRTSMSRLVSEGWLTNERVGRQSRYHFTELALRESAQADGRIYGLGMADWTRDWTLVFLSNLDAESRELIGDHLRWNGFVRIGREVLASPTNTTDDARAVCNLIVPGVRPAVATAAFGDVEHLVEDGFFTATSDGAEVAAACAQLVELHSGIDTTDASPMEAYAIRTMLVHDLRRIRLRWADSPEAEPAIELAAQRYGQLSDAAAPLLSDLLDLEYPRMMKGRFGQD